MKKEMKENTKFNKTEIIDTLKNCNDIKDAAEHYYEELLILKQKNTEDPNNELIKNILTALGNEDRFLILEMLKQKDRCVCELEAILQKSQPAVSHHIQVLEKAGLIRGWKKGKFTHYSFVKQRWDEFNNIWRIWAESITNWFG